MFSPVEEIKQKLDLVDFISGFVQLKKAGANFKAPCPFHSEKTPSFMVSRAKQIWHCFGCNEGGDIFKFLMKLEGVEFPEALKILAAKAGVILPQYDPQITTLRNTVLNILDAAAEFFAQALNSPNGKKAKDYLIARGLDEKTIKLFNLGYAPNAWDDLFRVLVKKFQPADIFAAGLTVKKDGGGGFYDRFRHRLMFPIKDIHGNVAGFTGRILDEAQSGGKYVNTPETLVYNKSRIIYGLDLAKQAVREKDLAVIMEGNMDVIAAHQFGFANTIASSGTALTLDQLGIIKRYTNNIALAFDADPAGQSAAKRGIDLALAQGMNVRVITIPEGAGKDPDDCLRKNKDLWQQALTQAQDIMEWYFAKAEKKCDLSKPQGRREFTEIILPEAGRLPSLVEQDFWLKKVSALLDLSPETLKQEMRRFQPGVVKNAAPTPTKPTIVEKSRKRMLEEDLMALMAVFSACWAEVFGRILPDFFSLEKDRALYIKFADYYNVHSFGQPPPASDFGQWLAGQDAEISGNFNIKELQGSRDFDAWDEEKKMAEARFIVNALRREFFKERRTELTKMMRQAELAGDQEAVNRIGREFEEIMAQER
ncbi:MAG: DNA primase [bacterium]|nr:DNA primase [bacterium]